MQSLLSEAARAQQAGDLARARALYEDLLKRPGAPASDIFANLSIMAFVEGDAVEAEKRAREALVINPNDANTYNNLGLALKAMGRTDEAVAAFAACVKRHMGHAQAWANLASLLVRMKKLEEAQTAIRHALKAGSDMPAVVEAALHATLDACDWQAAERVISLAKLEVTKGSAMNPYAHLLFCLDPEELLQANRNYARKVREMAVSLPQWERPETSNSGKIRVGFYSCTLRDHATGYIMREMLEHYDRERFEFIAFPYASEPPCAFTKVLLDFFCDVQPVAGLPDREALAMIRKAKLDILIDLDGYANGGKGTISAARAAPVQVNWLGYPCTMGADFIDYIIADDGVIPEELAAFYDEKVVRLPGGYFPNDGARPVSDRFASRSDLGFAEDAIILCAFNQPRKITRPIAQIWADLLKRVPKSVLWLWHVHDLPSRNLRAQFEEMGVPADKVQFSPSMPSPDHLCRYRHVDLFLDTFPGAGHTMTTEALYMGVPMVTLRGRTFPSRVASSMMSQLGLDDWIADDFTGYADRLYRLTTDDGLRRDYKTQLRRAVGESRIFSGERFVREFEAALGGMASRARAGLPPQSFTAS